MKLIYTISPDNVSSGRSKVAAWRLNIINNFFDRLTHKRMLLYIIYRTHSVYIIYISRYCVGIKEQEHHNTEPILGYIRD